MIQKGTFLLLLGVSCVLCWELEGVVDLLSDRYGIDAVDKWLNATSSSSSSGSNSPRDQLLRIQYKAVVHQLIFNEVFAAESRDLDPIRDASDTLAAARLYIDAMLAELAAAKETDMHARRSLVAKAIADLGRMSLASPRLGKTIETWRRYLRFIDFKSKHLYRCALNSRPGPKTIFFLIIPWFSRHKVSEKVSFIDWV